MTATDEKCNACKLLEAKLGLLSSELDFYKRRERDICLALPGLADGGKYREDIIAAIKRIIADRDEADRRVRELEDRLKSAPASR